MFIVLSGWLASASCASLPVDDQGQQTEAADTQTGNTNPLSLQTRPESQPETEDPDQRGDNAPIYRYASWFAPSSVADWLLVLVTLAAVGAAWKTIDAIRAQARAAEQTAIAANTNAKAVMFAERAYIRIEQTDFSVQFAPDDRGQPLKDQPLSMSIGSQVRNVGQTPGTVVGGYFGFGRERKGQTPTRKWRPLPSDSVGVPRCFVYPDDPITFGMEKILSNYTDTLRDLISDDAEDWLWFWGQVDYVDRFNQWHRAGWGRRLQPPSLTLAFDESTVMLNYDEPLSEEDQKQYAKN